MITSFKIFEKRLISQGAKKNLVNFLNQTREPLTEETISELRNNPDLRPESKIVLYRGLLFDHLDEVGHVFNYESETPSSWTKDIEVAERFAKYQKSSTDNYYMAQFMVGLRDGLIDKGIGLILKYEFDPKDILVDIEMIQNKMGQYNYGYEKEVITEPINIKAEVVKVFTKKGEYTVDEFNNRDMSNNYQSVLKFLDEKLVESGLGERAKKVYKELENARASDLKVYLEYVENFDDNILIDIYKEYHKVFLGLVKFNITAPEYGSSEEDKKLYDTVKSIKRSFEYFDSPNAQRSLFEKGGYGTYYYERLLVSVRYDKNTDRMKPENVQKLKDRLSKEIGMSIEKAAELYKKYSSAIGNTVFTMSHTYEKYLELVGTKNGFKDRSLNI